MTTPLHTACTQFLAEQRATAAYKRGQEYFASDAVSIKLIENNNVTARVAGTMPYEVQLTVQGNGALHASCTCPVGQRRECCKHMIAVALTATSPAEVGPRNVTQKPRAKPGEKVAEVIAQLQPETLRTLLREAADNDKALRERILLLGAMQEGPEAAAKQWKQAIKNACAVRGFADWRRLNEVVYNIHQQLNLLDNWMDAGNSEQVIELAEYAADRVEGMIGKVDDSGGGIVELLVRIGEQHRRACNTARPEPRELAKRLFKREMEGKWDTFRDAAVHYRDVLGEPGLAVFRKLAESEWAQLKPLKAGDDESRYSDGRFSITRIMENLARQSGNVDALVRVYERDLSGPWSYLQIAETLLEAGRAADALQWAERGLKTFSQTHSDARLTTFVIERYLADGLTEDALRLAIVLLKERPRPESWKLVKRVAQQHGGWPALRAKLLDDLRAQVKAAPKPGKAISWHTAPHLTRSTLVEILLHDGDTEAAWQEAVAGPCRDDLLEALATRRAQTHPQDSIAVFKKLAADALRITGKTHYPKAINFIAQAVALMRQHEGKAATEKYLAELREEQKRRTAFIEMLAQAGM